MSALSKKPSTFTSARKLVFVTAFPDCDFVCVMSAESTKLSPLVSPVRTPSAAETLNVPVPSVTPCKVTELYCAFGRPETEATHDLPSAPTFTLPAAPETDPQLVI